MKNRVTGCTRNRVIKHGWTPGQSPINNGENQSNMAKSMKITYPLVMTFTVRELENDQVEIVDLHGFPIKNGDFAWFFVCLPGRVSYGRFNGKVIENSPWRWSNCPWMTSFLGALQSDSEKQNDI